MIDIDGSKGGGGLVRMALTLAALTGESVRIASIRGARANSGLRPQHVAAVEAVTRICDADVSGATVGSETLTFSPDGLRGGSFSVDIGTAGSVMLFFDTLLPLAVGNDASLSVTATGGTDVKWSPTAHYLQQVKVPLLRPFGLEATVETERTGFYPIGGGEAALRMEPSMMEPIILTERGSLEEVRICSKASTELKARSVAERQATAAAQEFTMIGLRPVEQTVRYVDAASVGSAVGIRLRYDHTMAGFDALGERSKPAEEVGRDAAEAARTFEEGHAAVDRYMADQLLIYLALVGGELLIPDITEHVKTGRTLLSTFGLDVSARPQEDGTVLLSTKPLTAAEAC